VAAAYVIRGYLVSPIEFWMVRKVAQIDLKTYFSQFRGPFLGSLTMTLIVLGLKYLVGSTISLQLRLGTYVLAGGIIYFLIVKLIEPSLWSQLLKLIRLVLPGRQFPGIQKS
jgi:PST family polysaccharide transporter